MSSGKGGYCDPPVHSRFKKGVSGNPKGRPKRQPPEVGEVVRAVMDVAVEYRESGRNQKASRRELSVRRHLQKALKGDVGAAEALLRIRAHAQVNQGTAPQMVQICDLLPTDAPPPKSSDQASADDEA